MIKRLFPYPLMSIALFVMWLMLNQSMSPGQIILGIVVTIIAMRGIRALQPEKANIRFSKAMVTLAGRMILDIFDSNWKVAKLILRGHPKGQSSGFIEMPLELKNRYGLAVLSVILTATPGTLWVQYNAGRSTLLLHVLDLDNEQYWIDLLKGRYERLLMEIFE